MFDGKHNWNPLTSDTVPLNNERDEFDSITVLYIDGYVWRCLKNTKLNWHYSTPAIIKPMRYSNEWNNTCKPRRINFPPASPRYVGQILFSNLNTNGRSHCIVRGLNLSKLKAKRQVWYAVNLTVFLWRILLRYFQTTAKLNLSVIWLKLAGSWYLFNVWHSYFF